MYEEEILPYYIYLTKGYGIMVNDIHYMCPSDFKPYEKAKKLEMEHNDDAMWSMGLYNYKAFATVMSEFGAGLSGKTSKAKYYEKPLFALREEEQLKREHTRKEYAGLTDEEKQQAELSKAMAYFNQMSFFSNKNKGVDE